MSNNEAVATICGLMTFVAIAFMIGMLSCGDAQRMCISVSKTAQERVECLNALHTTEEEK